VLKSFQGPTDLMFREEVKVLQSLSQERGVIGFYGSYTQNKTSNILYEYADVGNLENFFHDVKPPTDAKDIICFWSGMFKIVEAMIAVHGLSPANEHVVSRLQSSNS
jgi:serine/threonine protein kinase